MMVSEREPGDLQRLKKLIRKTRDARRRDRYRAVYLALQGKEAPDIADRLGRSRRSVQDWVYAYRDGGIDALEPVPQSGRPPKLSTEQEAKLKARLDAGPTPGDGVCTLRGKDVVRILEQEFGVKHTLGSIYGVLGRIGYSCLKPRTRHEKADAELVRRFQEQAPLLSGS
jgi:transposase